VQQSFDVAAAAVVLGCWNMGHRSDDDTMMTSSDTTDDDDDICQTCGQKGPTVL